MISTTTFCLKDLTPGSEFTVLLLSGFGCTLQTAHNLPWSMEKKKTQPRELNLWVMKLLRPGSLQQSLRNLVISRQPVRIIDLNQKSSPYILAFTSPWSWKRDSQLVFPMPAIGNSANNDFVTHRGQIQVVIMDWNCRLNFVGLTWPHLLWCSIEQELQRSLRWFLASVFVQVAHWVSEGGKTIAKRETFLAIPSLSLYQPPNCIVDKFLHCDVNKN